jgi:hypothetical protein
VIVLGLAAGIDDRYSYGLGLVASLVVGIVVALVVTLCPGWRVNLSPDSRSSSPTAGGSPQGPLESWRNDRVFGRRVGLGYGLLTGLVTWYLSDNLGSGLGNILPAALPVAIVYGESRSQ